MACERIHVICFGNELHGDDGFGPAVHARLAAAPVPEHVRLLRADIAGLAAIGCFEQSVIASLGWDKVRFHAPLEPGDLVHLELTLVEKRASSRPGRGIAVERGALVKADGTMVTSGDHAVILLMRPPA